ncbi:MAG TPA: hypothetical protein VLW55_10475 [Burkholderiaceae bacterium]|nr:hypothetical protein [Burkholderiaceae bacterium]
MKRHALMASSVGIAALTACASMPPPETGPMSFFVTSAGSGNGANLGGLAGADQICQARASAVNAGNRTWRAYLSADAAGGAPAVNARDRIGSGPWYNAKGVLIAADLDELHGLNRITKQTALTESGNVVNGLGDKPNQHDMLTGTNAEGKLATGDKNLTCNNWTSSGDGSAMVGHSDRNGLRNDVPAQSWNAAHPSRGCSQQALISTGGNGYFYCFAK